jgi:hypothetical protein
MGKRLSAAQKMRRYRERLQRAGLVHVQGWVSPERAKLINQIIAGAEASEGANGTLDEIRQIKERWGKLLEPRRDPTNGKVTLTRWEKCNELWQELAQAINRGDAHQRSNS